MPEQAYTNILSIPERLQKYQLVTMLAVCMKFSYLEWAGVGGLKVSL